MKLLSFSNEPMSNDEEITFNLILPTECGDLVLRNVKAWVSKSPLPQGLGDVLLSRDIIKKLGYDQQELLTKAQQDCPEYEVGGAVVEPTIEEANFDAMAYMRFLPTMEMSKMDEESKMTQILKAKVTEAMREGASPFFAEKTWKLLMKYVDVFRMVLGRDAPVDIEPLQVRLKPDAVPVKSKNRIYPQEHRDFMARHMKELTDAGLCYRNNKSRWTSPPLIVKKRCRTVSYDRGCSRCKCSNRDPPMAHVHARSHIGSFTGVFCVFSIDFFIIAKNCTPLPLTWECLRRRVCLWAAATASHIARQLFKKYLRMICIMNCLLGWTMFWAMLVMKMHCICYLKAPWRHVRSVV
jgi:hypothetical protein